MDKRLRCPECGKSGVPRGHLKGYTYLRCPWWVCRHEWCVQGYLDVPLVAKKQIAARKVVWGRRWESRKKNEKAQKKT